MIKSASDVTKDAFIHTQGNHFYLDSPQWEIEWMAHSLGQKVRFGGHADKPYSVAEHSVLVSLLMEEETGGDPFEGLMHDAAESVLPDVNSPWKKHFPDLKAREKILEADIRRTWALPLSKTQACTKADWLALFIEAAQILPERGTDFDDPYNLRPEALRLREEEGWSIVCVDWEVAKSLFLQRFDALRGRSWKSGA